MLDKLDFSVTFPTTGRTLSGQHVFRTGFGAIVGPNEAGKSVILEMIRFCLFGTAALRGASVDYKSLKAMLGFQIRGQAYEVRRTISTAKLFRDGAEICNGVKGTNAKVAELLGFGLTVFDVACAANQGDIEKLGAMAPTERKRMVDSVIGLSVIDDLAKWCGDEALGLSRMVEGMEKTLTRPIEPKRPVGYHPLPELEARAEKLREWKSELDQLEGWLSHTKEKPTEPAEPCQETTQQLEDAIEAARRYEEAQKALALLPDPPEAHPDPFEGQHEAYELWQERQAFLRTHPRSMTAEQIAAAEAEFQLLQEFRGLDHAKKRLNELLAHGHHECPACAHQWPVAGKDVEKAQARVDDQEASLAGKSCPAEPDMVGVETARRQLQAWERDAAQWERLKDVAEAPAPTYTRQQLAKMRVAHEAQARRPELEAVPNPGRTVKELNALLRERIAYEHRMVRYEDDVAAFEEWQAEAEEKSNRAIELGPEVAHLAEVEAAIGVVRTYEHLAAEYEKHKAAFDVQMIEIAARRAEEEGFRKGKEALVILRRLVKQHLVPSLNRVASHLISKMTGGERNQIVVTEDFDITVDGQPLDTLSGSGKAVANLALRLGLGQVLTNGQFSVFLGDEIDASMDQDRAQNTAQTLEYLAERVSQILLVTHKYPSADYYIELEGNATQHH